MSTSIHNLHSRRRCSSSWALWARQLPDEASIGLRSQGFVVTDHRSSWVRRLDTASGSVFVKTYRYEGWRHHLRNLGRRTAPWSDGRATREFDALTWLRDHALLAPEPLLVLEQRRLGFLQSATLVTVAHPGIAAAALLPTLEASARSTAIDAITSYVHQLHETGFRDGNMDLRNLLLHRTATGFEVAKLDSPRYRIRPPGPADDRWTRADWQRLRPQLAAVAAASSEGSASSR